MISVNVIWVQISGRIGTVFSKLLPVNKLSFSFLIKHLHICYNFFYKISDQEICSAMLYKFCNFSPFFIFLCWFCQVKSDFESCKQWMWELSKFYLINRLNAFRPISEIDWCQVIFVFLFRFLLSGIFATLCQYISKEKTGGWCCKRLRRHTAQFLLPFNFLMPLIMHYQPHARLHWH